MLHVATNTNSNSHSGNREVTIGRRYVEPRFSKFERDFPITFETIRSTMKFASKSNWFFVAVYGNEVGVMEFDNFKSAQFQLNQYKALLAYECKKQSYYIAVFYKPTRGLPQKVSYFENFPKARLSVTPIFRHSWIAKVSCDSGNPNTVYSVCPKVSAMAYNKGAMFTKYTSPDQKYGYKARLEFRRLKKANAM